METADKTKINVQATINAPVEKVWQFWTDPEHIIHWNQASDDWHTPRAENDLREGGRFLSRMEAKDGSQGFDFGGTYDEIILHKRIAYTMDDERKVVVDFDGNGSETHVSTVFEAENTFSVEMQRTGWQAILDNFKSYVESMAEFVPLEFEITIAAPVGKVYDTMLGGKSYEEWTSVFMPGSHFKGSWDKGSKILFLAPGENGEMGGMVSRIKENIPNQFVSIEHLGVVDNGKEITEGPEVESWAGGLENYTFREENGQTVVTVNMDSTREFKDYFQETWPKALEKLKEICEQ
ncbi:SRPBCC family protein [Negadavirga shengliensis]|uniref:SRPBCC family protein n=1 Tax=Negadavirga shengliensis TaxID=1389218 RepID=A0ABV9SUP2_9BACT